MGREMRTKDRQIRELEINMGERREGEKDTKGIKVRKKETIHQI
jgi:hypothetical protein